MRETQSGVSTIGMLSDWDLQQMRCWASSGSLSRTSRWRRGKVSRIVTLSLRSVCVFVTAVATCVVRATGEQTLKTWVSLSEEISLELSLEDSDFGYNAPSWESLRTADWAPLGKEDYLEAISESCLSLNSTVVYFFISPILSLLMLLKRDLSPIPGSVGVLVSEEKAVDYFCITVYQSNLF